MAKSKRNLTPIYLKAMERIESGKEEYSCLAIDPRPTGSYNYPARLYAGIFSPDGICDGGFSSAVSHCGNRKALRLTMLALAAACWRDFV